MYEQELNDFNNKLRIFQETIQSEKSEIEESRRRDYQIYKSCLRTAYYNDENNNFDLYILLQILQCSAPK